MNYTIAQAAQRTGLTAHTLRYYDREGLLPFVQRTPGGARVFKEEDFEWLSVITCLKRTGMQVKQIRQYIDWCLEGDSTRQKRLEMFLEHRREVEAELAQLNTCMELIDYKIGFYTDMIENDGEVDVIVKTTA